MKKIVVILAALLAVIGCFGVAACDGSSSTAVTAEELVREDFAANKEKEDDEKGREHIEIPADAEKITIKNEETNEDEEWTVVRSVEDFGKIFLTEDTLSRNYIMANDVELKEWNIRNYKDTVFTGKLDGNNYKFVNEKEVKRTCLFYTIRDAVVENIIFSYNCGILDIKKQGNVTGDYFALITYRARTSVIKNCVNYSQSQVQLGGSFVYDCSKTIIENCINYGDFSDSYGGIASYIQNCTVRNCKNYGNLASYSFVGGIASYLYGDNLIENCENYGKIAGKCGVGGIAGSTLVKDMFEYWHGINKEDYTENQIIKNCKNYGDIYLLKEEGDKRCESTGREYQSLYTFFQFGGIAGSVSYVENCTNEGSFYGFENIGKDLNITYLGGVVGRAIDAINCENKGIIKVQKKRSTNVGDVYGFLDILDNFNIW